MLSLPQIASDLLRLTQPVFSCHKIFDPERCLTQNLPSFAKCTSHQPYEVSLVDGLNVCCGKLLGFYQTLLFALVPTCSVS